MHSHPQDTDMQRHDYGFGISQGHDRGYGGPSMTGSPFRVWQIKIYPWRSLDNLKPYNPLSKIELESR